MLVAHRFERDFLYPQVKKPRGFDDRGALIFRLLPLNLFRIRHSFEFRSFHHQHVVEKRGGVMNFSEYLDLFVVLCRLILYIVEIWKARR